jgi:TP901 family phage tail tape measure protein
VTQNFETTGLRVVIEGVQKFNANLRQMTSGSEAFSRSLLSVEQVSERTAAKINAANDKVANKRNAVGEIERKVAAKIRDQELRTQALRDQVAAQTLTGDNKVIASRTKLALAEAKLSDLRAEGEFKIAAAQTASSRAIRQANEIATQAALANQIALGRLTGQTQVARTGFSALASFLLGPFRLAGGAAKATVEGIGKALIAVTGFSNRLAVSLRFGVTAFASLAAAFVVGTASQFEDTLAKIDNLTEATADEVAFLSTELKALAQTIPKSPNELGQAAFFVLSSGIKDVNQALEITKVAATAAAAGLGNTDQVARVLTSVINAYGKENINAAEAADILFTAIQQGSAEAEDFTQGLGRLLGIAPQLGIEFDQLAAAVADLTNVGLPANQATTALLGIMNQLISPSDRAKEALESAGLSIEDLRRRVSEQGLIQALVGISDELDNNIQSFEQLFPEVRGLTGALLLLRNQGSAVSGTLDSIRNSGGIVDEAFKRVSETFSFQANLLKNQLLLFLIDLGQEVLPGIVSQAKNLVSILEENREAIVSFVKDGIDVAIEAGKSFITALLAINRAFSSIVGQKTVIVGALVLIGFAFATTFGGIPLLIAGIITGIGFLIRNFDKVRLAIVDFGLKAIPVLQTVGLAIETFLTGPLGVAARAIEGIGSAFGLLDIGDLSPTVRGLEEAEKLLEKQKTQIEADIAAKIKTDVEIETPDEEVELFNLSLKELEAQFKDMTLASDDFAKKLEEALKDGIIDFAEATELGIDAITAGALEASVIFRDAEEKAFDFSKTLSKVANAFVKSEQAAQKLVLALAREALAKIRAAQQALFGGPTQEVAALELSLARLEEKRAAAALRIVPELERLQDELDALRALRSEQGKAPTDNPIVAEVIQKGLGDNARNSINAFGGSVDDAIKAVEEQIAALERELELIDREGGAIERQIALLQAQSDILQAQITLADKTLETQETQRQKAIELIDAMGNASAKTVELANKVGEDIIPEFDAMRVAVEALNRAFGLLEDEEERDSFIRAVGLATGAANDFASALRNAIDAIQENAANPVTLRSGEDLLLDTVRGVANKAFQSDLPGEIGEAKFKAPRPSFNTTIAPPTPRAGVNEFELQFGAALAPVEQAQLITNRLLSDIIFELSGVTTNAHGGLITSRTLSTLGESGPELVLPLTQPSRSRELIRSLPPNLASGIFGQQQQGPQNIFGNLNVSGETLESMRIAAKNEVDRAFRQRNRIDYHRVGI